MKEHILSTYYVPISKIRTFNIQSYLIDLTKYMKNSIPLHIATDQLSCKGSGGNTMGRQSCAYWLLLVILEEYQL